MLHHYKVILSLHSSTHPATMAIKTKFLLFVLFVFLLSATATFSLGTTTERDHPYLEQCKQICDKQSQSPQQRELCKAKCEDLHKQKYDHDEGGDADDWSIEADRRDPWMERQHCQEDCTRKPRHQQQDCQKRCDEKYKERQHGGRGDESFNTREREDPQRELQQCKDQCQSKQDFEERGRCQQECWRRFQEQQKEHGRGGESEQGEGGGFHHEGQESESREQQGGEQEIEENPYFFRSERFSSRVRGEHGNLRVLERFNKRSKLLKGLENYRVSIIEANPNTFMVPSHWDADCICVVLSGRGAITLLHKNNKETHNLKQGDIFRTRAGSSLYKINRDNNEKLYILSLEIPVNTPGQFEGFFLTGSHEHDSFFNAFSDDILQAAFKNPAEEVKKMFQGKDIFVQASQEQIRSLTEDSSEHGVWPFHKGGESRSRRPYNIFENGPAESNKFGKLYEAKPSDYEELQDNDVAVSFANITRGGMAGPFYNSRSTKIAMVANGNGFVEMACPHMSQQGQRQQGQEGSRRGGQSGSGSSSYHKIRARLSRGDLFIVPAGHPVATVASTDQNLELVCFAINAENNERYPLAGNNFMLKQMEREAKVLSFNIPLKQVEEMLNKQEESWFFAGPRQEKQRGGGGYASA